MISRAWPVVALLLVAACMPEPPRPGVTTTPLGTLTDRSIDEAEDAVVAQLEALGFTVEDRREAGLVMGRIERGAPSGWALCDRVLVHERDDRNRTAWAEADDLGARVTVRFSDLAGRTSVTVAPRFDGLYLDRFDNLPFDRACASQGVLEPMILASAGGG
jgi:hypothetical protein